MKELQKRFGEIYLGKKNITTYGFFIISNTRIYFQMDAAGFEMLLFTILSEEPFKNHRIHMTEEKYDYTIYDCISQNFCMLIGETMTCLSCHKKKRLVYYVIGRNFIKNI